MFMPFEDVQKREPRCPEPNPYLPPWGFGAIPDSTVIDNVGEAYGKCVRTFASMKGPQERDLRGR